MAAQSGRTVSKYVRFHVDDNGGTLRTLPIRTLNGIGLTAPLLDLTSLMDAIRNALPETPDCVIQATFVFDTTAAQAAGTLSGSHTVLSAINNLNTPLSLDIQVGMRQAWESGEPQFGITSSSTSGFLFHNYVVDLNTMECSGEFYMFPGSAAPAWGTAAET